MCDQVSECGGKKCPFGFGSGGYHSMGGGDHDGGSGHGGCPYGFGKQSHHGHHHPGQFGPGGGHGHHGFGGHGHGQHGFGGHGHGFDHHGSGPMPQCPWMVARMHACPWAWGVGPGQHGGAHCKTAGKGDFSVSLKVEEYCSEELEVKVVGTEVVVHGKHEARPEQAGEAGTVTREFTRRFPLGDGIDPDTVIASLSGCHELTIIAKKKVPEGEPRVVPIAVVGGSGDQ